ncbi:MAG: hypothetical protein WCK51_00310 [Armatimonadota bacterium]
MSFSQYPRPGDVTDYLVPTQQLQRLVQFGLIWGGLWVGSSTVLSTFELVWGPKYLDDSGKLLLFAPLALGYLVFAIAFGVIVFQWVGLAWQTVVGLRGLQPRVSSKGAAWLSVMPVVNLISLIYVLDFLVVRSRSKDERTMNALSVGSTEPLATVFCYALVTHFCTLSFELIPTLRILINTASIGFNLVDMVSHIACYWLGYLLSRKVNDQLKAVAVPPRFPV